MSAHVFVDFRNTCLEMHQLDPAWFLIAPGLAWLAALKMAKVKLDLLTDINMLLMLEKVSEVEYLMPFTDM